MKFTFALIACVWFGSVHAQTAANLLIPSPVGLVITAGTWLWNLRDPEYQVTVQGSGATEQAALDQAFRTAVETAVGSLVVATSQTDQDRLVKDQIITHSAARVDRYEIVSKGPGTVTIRAWVRRSAIVQAWITESSAEAYLAPARTHQAQLTSGDAVWREVLTSYPQNSFAITMTDTKWTVGPNRQQELRVKFHIEWSAEWRRAVTATAQATTTDLTRLDTTRQNLLLRTLLDTRPQVQITVLTAQNQVVYSGCKAYSELDHQQVQQYGTPFVTWRQGRIDLNSTRVTGHLALRIPSGQERLYHSVKLQVIPFNQCA
jgi:hypothetical protein